jgi:glycosyltransferase involved in cell wall biosynthesis
MNPILSICIPTFNRAVQLDNLLNNIYEIKKSQNNTIEICISNNCSTDNTSEIIKKWTQKLKIKTTTQATNIGGNKNIIEVTRLATGKWILLVGDDDELIIEAFEQLLSFLTIVDAKDWILVGVNSGNSNLLGYLKSGKYEAIEFRKVVLRTGLYRFGFISSHIFSSHLVKEFTSFSPQQYQTWPHVALFLCHLKDDFVHVYSEMIVTQAGGGNVAFFKIGDWMIANLRKINVLYEIRKKYINNTLFFYAAMLRELYSLMLIKDTILWKILEPKEFFIRGLQEFIKRYFLLGPFIIFTFFHLSLIILIMMIPSILIKILLKIIGRDNIINDYNLKKKLMADFDMISRGSI